MADKFSRAKRSAIMAKVKSKNTAPEVLVRRLLHGLGFRFRLHRSDIPGTPDIVLPRHRKAILIHGCFWHGHSRCKRAKTPVTNAEFWLSKIAKNKARDRKAKRKLREQGWKVLELWQCQLKSIENLVGRLEAFLRSPGL
jgi:DNA mismatch endonuclease, patch repair protein